MSRFVFEATAVLELLAHAKAAPRNVSPYNLTPNPGPGLMLVKDDGVYLMSNGEPGLRGAETTNKVVYARGYEALPATASTEEQMAQYDKIFASTTPEEKASFAKWGETVERSVTNRYRVDAGQSYVSKEVRASDPDFWSAK